MRCFSKKYFKVGDKFSTTYIETNCNVTWVEVRDADKGASELGIKINADLSNFLNDEQSNLPRDIALHLYDYNSNFAEDTISLMKIALSSRPNGPIIASKIKDWSKK